MKMYPSDFEAAPQPIRVTLCHVRQAEITDGLVQLLIQLVHKISVRVAGKNGILVKFATAALALPEQIVRTAQSPCAGTLLP